MWSTLLSVEIAPCSTGRRLGPDASCSQDAVSIRFARIVAVRPGTDARYNGWVEVRRSEQGVHAAELPLSVTDGALVQVTA